MSFLHENSRDKVVFVVLIFLIAISGYFGYIFWERQGEDVTSATTISWAINAPVFFDAKSQEVYHLIETNYYRFDQKSPKELEDAFLLALVASLGDKHSSYFNSNDAKAFSDMLAGDFEGIGAIIEDNVRGVKIAKVLDGSPAEKAWLLDGDIIVSVDGKNIAGLTADEAVTQIRGPKGSDVLLGYTRGQGSQDVAIARVTRDVVNVPSVASKMLDNHAGYIEVVTFGEHTNDEFASAVRSVMGSWATSIILDLRNNGGGYLDTAIKMLSIFLPNNTVAVKTQENDPKNNEILFTHTGLFASQATDIPLVVLVNGLSASASEIVAGALQDHHRAIIVGEVTYGKGSVQEPFDLKDGSMIKLTVAKWYTPNGREIDAKGITPDIPVYLLDEDYTNQNDRQLHAAETILQKMIANKLDVQKAIATFQDTSF